MSVDGPGTRHGGSSTQAASSAQTAENTDALVFHALGVQNLHDGSLPTVAGIFATMLGWILAISRPSRRCTLGASTVAFTSPLMGPSRDVRVSPITSAKSRPPCSQGKVGGSTTECPCRWLLDLTQRSLYQQKFHFFRTSMRRPGDNARPPPARLCYARRCISGDLRLGRVQNVAVFPWMCCPRSNHLGVLAGDGVVP